MICEMQSYMDTLRANLKGYSGKHADVIRYIPELYAFYLNLLDDARFPARLRLYVNAAIAYLVSPVDVIPEEEIGPEGYIDDVFLCAYVADILTKELGHSPVLHAAWEADEPLEEVIQYVLSAAESGIDAETRAHILRYVGMKG